MNNTIQTIKNHTSIRKFNDQPITEVEEQTILECALRGASAGNMMQCSIITIRDQATLDQLAESCDHQPFIAGASMALLFVADNYKWSRFFEARGVTDHDQPYAGPEAPDMMLAIQDAMIAAQNSVLAAESMGIGTCYIGDIMEQVAFHRELFSLPDYTMPVTLVVMGHYDKKPSLRRRFAPEYVIHKEKYPAIDSEFINGMFSEEESKNSDFAQKFYSRKIEADFFKEMIRSIKVYMKQWL